MTVGEFRDTVRLALLTEGFDTSDIDRTLRFLVSSLHRDGHDISRRDSTITCTPFDNEMDLSSISGFIPSRVLIAEVGYNNRGVWNASLGSIAINDLVQGDGVLDRYFYVATAAHTASAGNRPPDGGVWTRVRHRRGTPLLIRTYDEVQDPPRERGWSYRGSIDRWCGTQDRPQIIGFGPSHTSAVLWPTPEVAYPIRFVLRGELNAWTIGGVDAGTLATVINVDGDYLEPVAHLGVPAILEWPDPDERRSDARWTEYRRIVERIKADAQRGPVIVTRRPNLVGF